MLKIEINNKTYIGELNDSDFKGVCMRSYSPTTTAGTYIGMGSNDSELKSAFKDYLAKEHTGDLLSMNINTDDIIMIKITEEEALEFDRLKEDFSRLIAKAQKDMEAMYFLRSV